MTCKTVEMKEQTFERRDWGNKKIGRKKKKNLNH